MENVKVTFWKSDFKGETLQWLVENLKAYAIKGNGYWFHERTNFIEAYIPLDEYEFCMNKVATY